MGVKKEVEEVHNNNRCSSEKEVKKRDLNIPTSLGNKFIFQGHTLPTKHQERELKNSVWLH